MARDDKPLRLRPVDEDVVEAPSVIRLENRETENRYHEAKPVRLGTLTSEPGVSLRLDLPDKVEIELRTHQPGLEALIEPEPASPELVEENWGESSARKNPIPWGWFVLIGLAVIGAVAWSLSRVEQADLQVKQVREETRNVLVDDAKDEQEATLLIERIEATIRAFFDAKSVESMARLTRQPERVEPFMRQHYGGDRISSPSLESVRTLQPLTLENRGDFWIASVILADGTQKNLVIEIGTSGEPRIDWETMVCHQPMKWDDFATQRPTGTSMDFRVYVEPDEFYSHEFVDDSQWKSFRLTALDSEETLFGYMKAENPANRELMSLIQQNGGRKTSMILRLVIPEGLKSRRGVVIEKLVSPRWLYLDPPDSGS